MKTLVVLHEPLIPQNTGNIGRLCVGFDCELALVGPLGFEIDDKRVKRAGLDYWPHLKWRLWPDLAGVLSGPGAGRPVYAFTKRAEETFYDAVVPEECVLLFGKETTGLEEAVIEAAGARSLRFPMLGPIRSFNLSNTVAMALSEIYRSRVHAP